MHILKQFGNLFPHPDADSNGITKLKTDASRVGKSGATGFTQDGLELHTDRSNVTNPPEIVSMLYAKNTGSGGDFLYADGQELYCLLRNEFPTVFRWALSPEAVQYNDGISSYSGPIFCAGDPGKMRVRLRVDDFGYYAMTHNPDLQIFLKCAHKLTRIYRPNNYDLVIMDNTRWLHGRTKFEGSREVWRVLLQDVKTSCGFMVDPSLKHEVS
jgi:alpha-ketoglutarate-dependent taurine dioxygenase